MNPIHIYSIGAGVQSSTMGLMASAGELLPMPAAGIFADTQDEPGAVYRHLEWLKIALSFPVHTVSRGHLMNYALQVKLSKKSGKHYMQGGIPAFLLKPDGKKVLLGRRCTLDFKIEPIRKKTREIIGKPALSAWRKRFKSEIKESEQAKKEKRPTSREAWALMQQEALVVMAIGISTDEAHRAKPSVIPWIRNSWPLLDEKPTSRQGCLDWLKAKGYPEAPRSACRNCPFHGDEEWALQTAEDFAGAVAYEKAMQEAHTRQELMEGTPYLHNSCKPLGTIDFSSNQPGRQQVSMFGNECEGLCGV